LLEGVVAAEFDLVDLERVSRVDAVEFQRLIIVIL
jgi:hypothetical protein